MNLFFKHILLIVFVFTEYVSIAQSSIDSLQKVLVKAKPDSAKVNVLMELGWEYSEINYDTAILFCTKAKVLAQKIKWIKGIALTEHQLGTFYDNTENYKEAITHYSLAVNAWHKILRSGNKRLIAFGKIGLARTNCNIGIVYFNMSDYTNALAYYNKALKIARELKDQKLIARFLGTMANVYTAQGNYSKAIKLLYSSLKIAEKIQDKQRINIDLTNLGILYESQGNYKKALEINLDALKIALALEDIYGQIVITGNIGINYSNLGNAHKALEYYFMSLKLTEEYSDKAGSAINYSNIGIEYGKLKDLKLSLQYFEKALALDKEMGNVDRISKQLCNIGSLYTLTGKFDLAEKYLKRSLIIADSIHTLDDVKLSSLSLSKLYDTTKRYGLALTYYKQYIAAQDSINNDANIRSQAQTEMQYAFDKQQATDSIKTAERSKQEHLKHEQEIRQQRMYTIGGTVLFLVMLIIAVVAYRAFKNKQKANRVIAQQKLLVEEKQKEILDSIHYAKRIQLALLPSEKYIAKKIK